MKHSSIFVICTGVFISSLVIIVGKHNKFAEKYKKNNIVQEYVAVTNSVMSYNPNKNKKYEVSIEFESITYNFTDWQFLYFKHSENAQFNLELYSKNTTHIKYVNNKRKTISDKQHVPAHNQGNIIFGIILGYACTSIALCIDWCSKINKYNAIQ